MLARRLAPSAVLLTLWACGSRPPPNGPVHTHEHCHDAPGGGKDCHTHPHDDAHKHSSTINAPSSSATPGAAHEHEHCHEKAEGNECHAHPHSAGHHPEPAGSAHPLRAGFRTLFARPSASRPSRLPRGLGHSRWRALVAAAAPDPTRSRRAPSWLPRRPREGASDSIGRGSNGRAPG